MRYREPFDYSKMLPCSVIPRSVTALYVFAVVNMMAFFHITLVEANVLVKRADNFTITQLADDAARFGAEIPSDGFWGHLMQVDPPEACSEVKHAPTTSHNWIGLIRRGGLCHFDEKVLAVQNSGFMAAIVYNNLDDDLLVMNGDKKEVTIPAVFIGRTDGLYLANSFSNQTNIWIVINNEPWPYDINSALKYCIPFLVVMSASFVITLVIAVGKWIRDYRRRRHCRLSKRNLKKLPIQKFKKGDNYDMCAICLEDYAEGDKLRILPCAHAYHSRCVDPWLLNSRRLCPVCKRKVMLDGEQASDSDSSDFEDSGETQDENTPLLPPPQAGSINGEASGSRPSWLSRSGLPSNTLPVPLPDSDSDEDSVPFGHSVSSQAEVHTSAPIHRAPLRGYGATQDSPSSSLGAVGGAQELPNLVEVTLDDEEEGREKKGRKKRKPNPRV